MATRNGIFYEDDGSMAEGDYGIGLPTTPTQSAQPSALAGYDFFSSKEPLQVPPEYMPSPNATQVKIEEEGFFTKLARGFEYAAASGTGRLPVSLQAQIARQETAMQQGKLDLGRANYIQSIVAFKRQERLDAAKGFSEAIELFPNMKAQLFAVDEAIRPAMAKQFAERLDMISPGSGDMLRAFMSNPSVGLAADFVLSESKDLQNLVHTMGYEKVIKLPQFAQEADRLGRQYFSSIVSRFDLKQQEEMVKEGGGLSEEEFRKLFKTTSQTAGRETGEGGGLPLVGQAFVNEYLNTEAGQALMAEQGVKLAATVLKGQEKQGAQSYQQQVKDAELKQMTEQLSAMDEQVKKYPSLGQDANWQKEHTELQQRRDVMLDLAAKPTVQKQTIPGMVSAALYEASGGRFNTVDELDASELPANQKAALMSQAMNKAGEVYAQGKMEVAMRTPAAVHEEAIYKRSDLLSGKVQRSFVPVSEGQLRKGDYVHLNKDQEKAIMTMNQAATISRQLFTMSKQVIKAKSFGEAMGQYKDYLASKVPGASVMIDPTVKVYYDGLDAWASRNARAIGAEVGVLTDRDVDRWVRVFPGPTDTAATVEKKAELFNKMLSYLVETNVKVIAGELPMNLRGSDKKHDDTMEGFLGRAEEIHKESGAPGTGTSRGQSDIERLRSEMLKGK